MSAYVYAIVVDGNVRYIGKGSGKRSATAGRYADHLRCMRRLIRHRAEGLPVPRSAQAHVTRQLAHAWLDGAAFEEMILGEGLTEQEAFDLEREMIASAPDGHLWNIGEGGAPGRDRVILNMGGRANKGRKHSEESKAKRAESLRQHWANRRAGSVVPLRRKGETQ